MTTTLIPSYNRDAARAAAEACGARLVDDPHGPQAWFPGDTAQTSVGHGQRVGAGDPDHAGTPDAQRVGAREAVKTRSSPDALGSHAGERQAHAVLAAGALALLPDWGIVSVSGDEAVKFLHAQTTNDIERQAPHEARLNGYCTPKGRLLAGGLLWREGEALRFAVSRPLAEPVRKRLSMFVLRAKAKLEDSSDRLAVLGLCGAAAPGALRELGIEPPAPLRVARASGHGTNGADARVPVATAIGLAALEGIGPRWTLVVPSDSLREVWAQLADRLAPVDSDFWRTTEVLAGEPRIVPATSEAFVPQTLNWELIGGVSFRKGCYPGQEIVARMHYRGKPKRRTFAAQLAEGRRLEPGADVFAEGTTEPTGTVVSCAPGLAGGVVLLYEAPIETAGAGGLRSADGRKFEPLALPYPLQP